MMLPYPEACTCIVYPDVCTCIVYPDVCTCVVYPDLCTCVVYPYVCICVVYHYVRTCVVYPNYTYSNVNLKMLMKLTAIMIHNYYRTLLSLTSTIQLEIWKSANERITNYSCPNKNTQST